MTTTTTTNTIAITVTSESNEDASTILHSPELRTIFATFGDIDQWVPLRCFSRILCVYTLNDSAELAKSSLDNLSIAETTLRVFRADANPLTSEISSGQGRLEPPPVEKNFLISPPGSPPVGWEPIVEDPPNKTPLARDLLEALRRLETSLAYDSSKYESGPGVKVLLEPGEGGVGVFVKDCSSEDEDEGHVQGERWFYGTPPKVGSSMTPGFGMRPIPTAMPPLSTSADIPRVPTAMPPRSIVA